MSFDGKYNVTIQTPMGAQQGTLELKQSGDDLTGSMIAGSGESAEIKNGKVNGDSASWDVDISSPMPMTLSFEATKAGDNLGGSVTLGAFGQSTFEGVPA
ncbi:hypothetical protein [Parvularcula marina]|uniref:Uncharacterized protein n=1 Tax=Parvularcula marina TaxID=2292771 RepID=A0A371RES7_9PROT|nr:hypothetical protein [Parvularcula marina]RFB03954.1 hypothetical protein DX908_00830 [Parvularcula marina]